MTAMRIDDFGLKEARFEAASSPLPVPIVLHTLLSEHLQSPNTLLSMRAPCKSRPGAYITSPAFPLLYINTGHQD